MKLYRTMPSNAVLIDFAFTNYPDCRRLLLHVWRRNEAQELFTETVETVHPERAEGVTMNFSADHLWALLRQTQEKFERGLPEGAEREYVDA